jgi:hypothetical protein
VDPSGGGGGAPSPTASAWRAGKQVISEHLPELVTAINPAVGLSWMWLRSARTAADPNAPTGQRVLEGVATVSPFIPALGAGARAVAPIAAEIWESIPGLYGLGSLGGGRLTGAAEAINLPAWRKITVDIAHILERHIPGAPFAADRDIFPSTMSEKGIMSAIRQAYESSTRLVSRAQTASYFAAWDQASQLKCGSTTH